jgi:branched-chain amino acid aminotransferase
MSVFYVNGQFVPSNEAVIPAADLAVLRGFGAFDFLRTYGGRPFRLRDNIARLRRSCEIIELALPYSDQEIYEIVLKTLEANRHLSDEFNIRLVVTGGLSPDNITPTGESTLIVMVTPLQPPPAHWYTDGVKVIIVDIERIFPDSKSTNYIPAIIAQKRAREQGAIEALYQRQGRILEGTTTNVFAFFGDELVTPAAGILPGITRQTVLELAAPHYPITVRELSVVEFLQADEVFITAANKQVVPVIQADETYFGDGRPGARTQHIMALFHQCTQAVAHAVPNASAS